MNLPGMNAPDPNSFLAEVHASGDPEKTHYVRIAP
jgi:hypothetical protein